MKFLRNEDGIALITALMFVMLCLGMIMTLLYYVIAGTKMSAAQKRYRSALEASYGGAEFVTKTIIPRLFNNYSAGKSLLLTDFSALNHLGLQVGGAGGTTSSAILKIKLEASTADWNAGISGKSVDPKVMPDFIFTLQGQNTNTDYLVYSKIVNTVAGVGLLDASGIDYLDAGIGVAGSNASTSPPRTPNVYSVEIQGEAAVNPAEKAGVTVLYAY